MIGIEVEVIAFLYGIPEAHFGLKEESHAVVWELKIQVKEHMPP